MRTFQERGDVVAYRLHVQGRHLRPHQLPPGLRVMATVPLRLVQRVLQQQQVGGNRRALR